MAVTIADDSNFSELLKGNEKVVVKYYADWCGSCRLFAPKYKRISNEDRYNTITFLDVNAEHNPEARKLGNVNNLPTFAIFRNGELIESVCTSKEDILLELIEKL